MGFPNELLTGGLHIVPVSLVTTSSTRMDPVSGTCRVARPICSSLRSVSSNGGGERGAPPLWAARAWSKGAGSTEKKRENPGNPRKNEDKSMEISWNLVKSHETWGFRGWWEFWGMIQMEDVAWKASFSGRKERNNLDLLKTYERIKWSNTTASELL